MSKTISNCLGSIALWASCLAVLACSTGVESTRTIKLSKADYKALSPSEEILLGDSLRYDPLPEWPVGKIFLVADNRISLLFRTVATDSVVRLKGHMLSFQGASPYCDAGGEELLALSFSDDSNPEYPFLSYFTKKSFKGSATYSAADLPFTIDLGMVSRADSILRGRKVWTNTRFWYDRDDNPKVGKKFAPVILDSVTPGNHLFPLSVNFSSADGTDSGKVLMNVRSSTAGGADSRLFRDLFFLSDPRKKHRGISDEVWDLICGGKLQKGMTKGECRLALGNPKDVNAGHDWNNTIDVWTYSDGTFLRFEDGLLVAFRQL